MGGVDKGLQSFQGLPLALHALQRLAPQVGPLLINANRNAAAYAELGQSVQAVADLETYLSHAAGAGDAQAVVLRVKELRL